MEITTAERYASGEKIDELAAQNFVKAFEATAERLGDDVAIRSADDSVTLTWNELRARSRSIAGGLAGLGVSKGDTVALMLNNRPEFIPLDLAAVFAGLVTLVGSFLDTASDLAVAASTLAVAALFNPLRRRVQRGVDHRFNRSRYDSERVMSGFTSSLRDEVDPDEVLGGWLSVVINTMQPASVGAWVRTGP